LPKASLTEYPALFGFDAYLNRSVHIGRRRHNQYHFLQEDAEPHRNNRMLLVAGNHPDRPAAPGMDTGAISFYV
jgi:hypothetical protein